MVCAVCTWLAWKHLLLKLCLQDFHSLQKLVISHLKFMAFGGSLHLQLFLQMLNLYMYVQVCRCPRELVVHPIHTSSYVMVQ